MRGGRVRLRTENIGLLGSFQCDEGEGVVDGPEPGVHDITVSLYDDGNSDIVIAEAVVAGVTTTNDPIDLGRVVLVMVPELCTGEDDDRDGDFDCEDSDCASAAECAALEEDCDAEGDEDADGDADCEDADCDGEPACEEEVCTAAAVTIATVYTRGGSGGASYNGDFVVLENRTDTDYDLTGHSLQTATILLTSWDVFALPAESIPANGAYLVAIGTPGSQGADVPAPDESFAGAGNLNDTALLAIALMPDAVALTACPTGTAIDLFSAGEEACAEGATVAPPGTTTRPSGTAAAATAAPIRTTTPPTSRWRPPARRAIRRRRRSTAPARERPGAG